MKPSEIGEAYNQITDLWGRESFDRLNGIEQHKKAIAFAKNRRKALDVGCGPTGRFIDLLLDSGFDPEGVDVSEKMIKLAKERHQTSFFINMIFVPGIRLRNMISLLLGIAYGIYKLINRKGS